MMKPSTSMKGSNSRNKSPIVSKPAKGSLPTTKPKSSNELLPSLNSSNTKHSSILSSSQVPTRESINIDPAIALLEDDNDSPMSVSVDMIPSNQPQSASINAGIDHEVKYVGTEARSLFFDRMKFMSHHNQISRHKPEQNITALHFEHDDKTHDGQLEQMSIAMDDHEFSSHDHISSSSSLYRAKTATHQYVSSQHSSLSSETPRSLASLIMNSSLPPIIISGPSTRSKASNPSSMIHHHKSSSSGDMMMISQPKSAPPTGTAMDSLHSKFDFKSPHSNSSSRRGSTATKQYVHHLASLALEDDDDIISSSYHDQASTSLYDDSIMSSASFISPKLQASISRYNSKRDLLGSNTSSPASSSSSSSRPLSPRSKFISKCLEKNMNPRASIILRKGIDHTCMNLQHLSLGNDMTCILADCLVDLPYSIESINLTNNGLDGKSIAPLLHSLILSNRAEIKVLNLSYNHMDKAAINALASYFTSTSAAVASSDDNMMTNQHNSRFLQTLILQHTQIDDNDADKILHALSSNITLTDIDLSNNKIGSNENRRSMQANYVTFTEALAQSIMKPSCPLTRLNLSWNTIRLHSAIALSKAIGMNSTLTYLDLSYNSLNCEGGEQLGDSLLDNTSSLHTLLLTHNGINSSAAFALGVGIMECKSLRRVALDDNPIGEAGGRALMAVPMSIGGRVKLTLSGCNVTIKEPIPTPNKAGSCWFNSSNPLGSYTLDLSKPYDRAVAFSILQIAANHSTYVISSAIYEKDKGSGIYDELELRQAVLEDHNAILDDRQQRIVLQLKKICEAASDIRRAKDLFYEIDDDHSGQIDRQEFQQLLEKMGIEVAPDWIDDVMKPYDLDESGNIDLQEFVAFLSAQYEEAKGRIDDLTQTRVMNLGSVSSCSSMHGSNNTPSSSAIIRPWETNAKRRSRSSSNVMNMMLPSSSSSMTDGRYIPPRSGILRIKLVDGFYKKVFYSTVRTFDHFYAKEVATSLSSGMTMMEYAIKNSKLRLSEAVALYYSMDAEASIEPMTILAKLVVLLDDPYDAKKMIRRMTRGDKGRLTLLKSVLGAVIRPVLGIFNGFYTLDLSKEFDRLCLSRLFEHNYYCLQQRQQQDGYTSIFGNAGVIGDTSQIFDKWSCFRNAVLSDEQVELPSPIFFPMPSTGRLSFDFASTARPKLTVAPGIEAIAAHSVLLTDMRCIKILRRLFNFNIEQVSLGLEKLNDLKKAMKKVNKIPGKVYYELDKQRAQSIGAGIDTFYQGITERSSLIKEGIDQEIIKVDVNNNHHHKRKSSTIDDDHHHIMSSPISSPKTTRMTMMSPRSRHTIIQSSSSSNHHVTNRPAVLTPITEFSTGNDDHHHIIDQQHNPSSSSSSSRSTMMSSGRLAAVSPRAHHGMRSPALSPLNIASSSSSLSSSSSSLSSPEKLASPRTIHMNNIAGVIASGGGAIIGLASNTHITEPHHPHHQLDDHHNMYDFDIVKRKSFKVGAVSSYGSSWAPIVAGAHYVVPKRLKKTPSMHNPSPKSSMLPMSGNRHVLTRKGTEDVIFEHSLSHKGLSEDVQSLRNILQSSYISQQAKGAAVLETLLDILGSCDGILCRHIVVIIHFYPWGVASRAEKFGSYYVELIVSLFPRIADIYNFEMVMKHLSVQDCAALYCRLGWLNIFNPMKLDGYWELSFGRYEERQIIKMLIAACKLESGENWLDKSFRWQRGMDEVPAWDLTVSYMADTTCPNRGVLLVKYYSGGGVGKNGCKPNIGMRKAMMSLVLLDEDDQEKVDRIDCEDDDDIEEEDEEDVTVVVPRSRASSIIANPTPTSDITSISSSDKQDSLSHLHTMHTAQGIGLGYATKAANRSASSVSLRVGEKYIQENKPWWDTLLLFNKAKKSIYGTHGTKVNHLNVSGI